MNMRAIKANGGNEAISDGGFMLPPGRALDICQQLQSAILEHKLSPGAKLSEDEVGEIFGVSRTVVRTALQALAHTGLVSVERNRGAFVARPSTREAHEVFEARALIEPRLARAAAKAATLADLAELEAHLVAEHEAMAAGNKGRALALSGTFHLVISRMAGQQVLDTFLRSLISRSSLVIALYWRRPDTTCEHHSHEALVKALAAHHGDDAEAIMKSHIIDLHSGLDLADKPKAETRLSEIFKN